MTDFITTDENVVAVLSTTVNVIQRPDSGKLITLVRDSRDYPVYITLTHEAEAALLAFLLARKGIKTTGPGPQGAPRSFDATTFADAHPKRYATDLRREGVTIVTADGKRPVATTTTPGWAAQLVAAWNAERA